MDRKHECRDERGSHARAGGQAEEQHQNGVGTVERHVYEFGYPRIGRGTGNEKLIRHEAQEMQRSVIGFSGIGEVPIGNQCTRSLPARFPDHGHHLFVVPPGELLVHHRHVHRDGYEDEQQGRHPGSGRVRGAFLVSVHPGTCVFELGCSSLRGHGLWPHVSFMHGRCHLRYFHREKSVTRWS